MGEISYIQKGEKTVNGQYRFASHDQVTAAIHPLLVKYGVLVIPTIDEIRQEGNRTVVKLCVVFKDSEKPENCFSSTWYGYGVDPGDKGPGKAVSYAYKYALLKTFALETGDDPDDDAKSTYEPAKCLEFELNLPKEMTQRERDKMNAFLAYSADLMKQNVEEVKKTALTRFPEFMGAFKKWNDKKEKS
jgi:hypothetical protein